MEFVSFIDTRKGKKLLKVFKSQRAANMFLKKNMDNILSKSGVDSIGSMSKKEWDTKEAKYAIESVNEGKKRYYQQDRVGSAKYTISYHDGKKKHNDGSDFFDIQTFKNKKDLAKFVNTLHKGGYKYGFDESVKESSKYRHLYYTNEDKKQIKDLVKKVKHEKLFYDVLDTMEKKYGKRKYRIWLEKSLRDFGLNPKHYDYRTNAAAEEKLFQLGK